jgi:hypothetical protein
MDTRLGTSLDIERRTHVRMFAVQIDPARIYYSP